MKPWLRVVLLFRCIDHGSVFDRPFSARRSEIRNLLADLGSSLVPVLSRERAAEGLRQGPALHCDRGRGIHLLDPGPADPDGQLVEPFFLGAA